MTPYALQRLLMVPPTILIITVIVFGVLRAMPGSAVSLLATQDSGVVDSAQLAQIEEDLGLNQPLHEQYARWVWGMAKGDFGRSLISNRPVSEDLRLRVPVTIQLASFSLAFALLVAVPLGVLSAVKRGTATDSFIIGLASIGQAAPVFLTASVALLVAAHWMQWSPPFAYRPLLSDPLSNLEQFALPVLALGGYMAALLTRLTRSAVLEVLAQDYVRTARAKGLRSRAVIWHHVLRTSWPSIITAAGTYFGLLLTGGILMENMFSLPGLGQGLVDSISHRDYLTTQSVMLVVGLSVMTMNVATDLLCSVVDPRLSQTDREGS